MRPLRTREEPAQTRTLPITYRDASVGRLVLPARGLRSRLSRRDERLLVQSFYDGQEFLWRLVRRLAGGETGA
mgnify:CR=1 FL=1